MIGAPVEKVADRFDRFCRRGVDYVGGAELFRRFEPLGLNVDDHNPRRASDASAADCVKPHASGDANRPRRDDDGLYGARAGKGGNVPDRRI